MVIFHINLGWPVAPLFSFTFGPNLCIQSRNS